MKTGLTFLLALLVSACVPVPTVELANEATLANSRETGTVAFGEFGTYFEHSGFVTGQPVLMVHGVGGGSSLFQYRKNSAALARRGYDVFALDLLGFGRSSRPAIRYTQDLHVAQLETFIETEIRRPTVLVANGLSAAYSIRLAAERPDLVTALVLTGPTGYENLARPQNEERLSGFDRFTGGLGELVYQVLLADNIQELFLLDAYAREESLTPEVLREFDQQLRVENAKWVILSFITGNLDQAVSELWPATQQPALIIWGQQAETTPVENAQTFLAARPEVELVTLDGAKLVPNEDQADMFNEVVLEFLSSFID